jgi:hypothetical protein
LSQDSNTFRMFITDAGGIHDVEFGLVNALPFDAAAMIASPFFATRHDREVLQRLFPPVLRCFRLAQRQMGWPTP